MSTRRSVRETESQSHKLGDYSNVENLFFWSFDRDDAMRCTRSVSSVSSNPVIMYAIWVGKMHSDPHACYIPRARLTGSILSDPLSTKDPFIPNVLPSLNFIPAKDPL